jgi:predicted RNA-binding Zn ribbon-like protein
MTQVSTAARRDVDLLRAFVNTLDLEDGVDVLDRAWLVDHGLVGPTDEIDAAELRRLAGIREAIRDLLSANNAVATDVSAAAATLDAAARAAGLTVRFRPDGTAALEAGEPGIARSTGRILGAVASLMGTDAWSRLKACRWSECRWAFFDEARNRSRAWCSMAACGNRAKARTYRERH